MCNRRLVLTYPQIAEAIRILQLEPELIVLNDHDNRDPGLLLKSFTHGYLSARIPILLGVDLFAVNRDEDDQIIKEEARKLGHHGVSITGYSFSNSDPNENSLDDYIEFRSNTIQKLYVHDDQVGPFARMEFRHEKSFGGYLTTSWKEHGYSEVVAKYSHVVVPLYHKIRIPLDQIMEIVSDFYEIPFAALGNNEVATALGLPWTWDIRLTLSNEVKSEIAELSDEVLSSSDRVEIMTQSLPKFLWRATAMSDDGRPLIDLLFDATDIVQGDSLACAIEYEESIGDFLSFVLTAKEDEQRKYQRRSSWPILQSLKAFQLKDN